MTAQAQPYPTSYYRTPEPPHSYYSSSSPSSSPPSSPSHTDDGRLDPPETPACAPQGRIRSRSTVLPRAHDRPPARPRACTVPGCHCDVAPPSALRPAFAFEQQQPQGAGPSTGFSPSHR
ncbi:hypothetical protein V8D89_008560 [Ganoderma adspersum]